MLKSIEQQHREKRRKAIQSAVVSALFLLGGGALTLWVRQIAFPNGGFWSGLLLILTALDLLCLVPLGIVLRQRMNEINGGEEDAARQY